MPIKRRVVQACCGRKSFIFELDKPIKKFQTFVLKEAGFLIPAHYYQAGVFYAQKGPLVSTGSYGTRMLKVRCTGPSCADRLNEFEQVLEKAINTTKVKNDE